MLTRYRATLSYQGNHFKGFQSQPNALTVQGQVENSLSQLFNSQVNLIGSGRTDSGVHSVGQVVHFDVPDKFTADQLLYKINSLLKGLILITDLQIVPISFNSRFSAVKREYHYLCSSDTIPLNYLNSITKINFQLSMDEFQSIANIFKGTHDFIRFKKNGSNENTTIREIFNMELVDFKQNCLYDIRQPFLVHSIRITANAFLYRMVRNIVGVLFDYFNNKISLSEIAKLINNEPFDYSICPAPSQGLCLTKVVYK